MNHSKRAQPSRGVIIEAKITKPPCLDPDLTKKMNITQICDLLHDVTNENQTFFKLLKYSKQSPTVVEEREEYDLLFQSMNSTLSSKNYYYSSDEKARWRQNAFVALCSHGSKLESTTFSNCSLFKRSFTNKGIGFTYNNAKVTDMFKKSSSFDEEMRIFSFNMKEDIKMMKSASSDYALKVFIDYNEEAVQLFENTRTVGKPSGDIRFKPKKVSVALHNPDEPANIRSNSFEIPLGYSTTVYITPKAREIDDSGKELEENQRNCRLTDDNSDLLIFKKYTRESCLFECKLKIGSKKCGCIIPWTYPMLLVS